MWEFLQANLCSKHLDNICEQLTEKRWADHSQNTGEKGISLYLWHVFLDLHFIGWFNNYKKKGYCRKYIESTKFTAGPEEIT